MGSVTRSKQNSCMTFMMEVLCYFMGEKRVMKKKNKTSRMRRKTFNEDETVDR